MSTNSHGSRDKKRDPGFQRETSWNHSVGAAGDLGRVCVYLTVRGFHLGFLCTLIWELWLISQFTGPDRGAVGRKQGGSSIHKEPELGGYFMCVVLLLLLLLFYFLPPSCCPIAVCIFSFHRKSLLLPFSTAIPGSRWLLPPSLLLCSPDHFFTDTLGGNGVLFWCPLFWNGCTLPRQMAVSTIFNCLWGRRFYNLF